MKVGKDNAFMSRRGLSLTRLHFSKSLCPQPALVRRANPLWSMPESYPPVLL